MLDGGRAPSVTAVGGRPLTRQRFGAMLGRIALPPVPTETEGVRRPRRQRNVSSEGWEEERCCKGGLESGTISAAVLRIADGDGLD